jgi:hypothetical protein
MTADSLQKQSQGPAGHQSLVRVAQWFAGDREGGDRSNLPAGLPKDARLVICSWQRRQTREPDHRGMA